MTIRLSQQEQQMLVSTVRMPESLQAAVHAARRAGEIWQWELSAPVAEQIRDCCARTFLQVGFDERYEPTEDGRILEALIDRFSPHSPPVV